MLRLVVTDLMVDVLSQPGKGTLLRHWLITRTVGAVPVVYYTSLISHSLRRLFILRYFLN